MTKLLTLNAAAKVLNRHPATVRNYCHRDGLPHRRVGLAGRIMIDPADLAEWQERPETVALLEHGNILKGLATA